MKWMSSLITMTVLLAASVAMAASADLPPPPIDVEVYVDGNNDTVVPNLALEVAISPQWQVTEVEVVVATLLFDVYAEPEIAKEQAAVRTISSVYAVMWERGTNSGIEVVPAYSSAVVAMDANIRTVATTMSTTWHESNSWVPEVFPCSCSVEVNANTTGALAVMTDTSKKSLSSTGLVPEVVPACSCSSVVAAVLVDDEATSGNSWHRADVARWLG